MQTVQLDTSTAGEHTIEYRATDEAGNTGTASRTVSVVDASQQDDEGESTEAQEPSGQEEQQAGEETVGESTAENPATNESVDESASSTPSTP